jgi:hypothetical protein
VCYTLSEYEHSRLINHPDHELVSRGTIFKETKVFNNIECPEQLG